MNSMDDLGFGASVWDTPSEPVTISSSSKQPLPVILVPSADTFDDFDDFGTPAETPSAELADDDFGDFGDFGEVADAATSADFEREVGFGEEFRIPGSYKMDWEPLRLDPMPSRTDLEKQVNDILAPIYGSDDISKVTTADDIREVGGIGQILMTPGSRELYNRLLQGTAPTKPPNWTRSRIRRQHLIALGIPVNLDQVLPRTNGKPLPTLNISTRPMSAPPVQRNFINNNGPATSNLAPTSRPGTPQAHSRPPASASAFGPRPELDETKIAELLDLDSDTLPLLPLATLERYMAELRVQTANTSSLLTYLLQTRESLQQDSETYNKLIGELVGEAQKIKTGKGRSSSRRGTGMT